MPLMGILLLWHSYCFINDLTVNGTDFIYKKNHFVTMVKDLAKSTQSNFKF